jgi:hypothetical protein
MLTKTTTAEDDAITSLLLLQKKKKKINISFPFVALLLYLWMPIKTTNKEGAETVPVFKCALA